MLFTRRIGRCGSLCAKGKVRAFDIHGARMVTNENGRQVEKANRTKWNGTRCTVERRAASRWLSKISLRERALANRVGRDTPWGGGAIERKQHPRAWATRRGRTKAIGSEGRCVWMVSIIERRINSIYGGGGVGGGLESVSVGVEECVPWRIVRGGVGGRGRGRGVSRQDGGNRMGLGQVVREGRGGLGNRDIGGGAFLWVKIGGQTSRPGDSLRR